MINAKRSGQQAFTKSVRVEVPKAQAIAWVAGKGYQYPNPQVFIMRLYQPLVIK